MKLILFTFFSTSISSYKLRLITLHSPLVTCLSTVALHLRVNVRRNKCFKYASHRTSVCLHDDFQFHHIYLGWRPSSWIVHTQFSHSRQSYRQDMYHRLHDQAKHLVLRSLHSWIMASIVTLRHPRRRGNNRMLLACAKRLLYPGRYFVNHSKRSQTHLYMVLDGRCLQHGRSRLPLCVTCTQGESGCLRQTLSWSSNKTTTHCNEYITPSQFSTLIIL